MGTIWRCTLWAASMNVIQVTVISIGVQHTWVIATVGSMMELQIATVALVMKRTVIAVCSLQGRSERRIMA